MKKTLSRQQFCSNYNSLLFSNYLFSLSVKCEINKLYHNRDEIDLQSFSLNARMQINCFMYAKVSIIRSLQWKHNTQLI